MHYRQEEDHRNQQRVMARYSHWDKCVPRGIAGNQIAARILLIRNDALELQSQTVLSTNIVIIKESDKLPEAAFRILLRAAAAPWLVS